MTYTAQVYYTPVRKDKKSRPRGAWTVVGERNGEAIEKVTYVCRNTAHKAVKQWVESAAMPAERRKVWQ